MILVRIGDRMRRGYKMTLGVLTIMILLTLTVGTSYSYYSISDVQDEPNNLTTTCFNVNFTDGGSGSINLGGGDDKYGYPISDEKALASDNYYEFTLQNTCTNESSAPVKYDIFLGDTTTGTEETKLGAGKIKYKLVESPGSEAPSGPGSLLNGSTYTIPEVIKSDTGMSGITTGYKLLNDTGMLSHDESKKYRLYLWIDESAENDIMGKNFTGSVIVYAYM